MARSQIQYGSQGGDVKTLQQMLNKNGYKLDEDGIFDTKTQAASLNNGATVSRLTDTSSGTNDTGFSNYEYKPSDIVKQANAALDAHMSQKPGEYKSQWQTQLDDAINKILNREKFSYDLNGDALYQQYKDKYIQQGKMAMQDTMGQAAAMTGGYGNSYAQSVGQQAYNAQLQNLNDIVPELYQMAYDRYNQEGQDLYNQYAMLGAQEDRDYDRHRDTVTDWQSDRNFLTDKYYAERNFDYDKFSDSKGYDYQMHRDAINDGQWLKNFEEGQRQTEFEGLVGSTPNDGFDPKSSSIKSFQSSLTPESAHDAIARKMYGPYTSYVATQLAKNTSLTDDEKIYLIQLYGITETDLDYARDKGYDI